MRHLRRHGHADQHDRRRQLPAATSIERRWQLLAAANNLIGGNPLLAPLGNYGGPTQTMALLPGSPAIDAGTSGAGIPDHRPARRTPGSAPSTSAPSRARASPSRPSPAAPRRLATIGTAFANPLAVTVTANNPVEPVDGGVVSFVANPRGQRRHGDLLWPPRPSSPAARPPSPPRPTTSIGSYTVVASAAGSSAVSFALTNTGPVFASLVVNTTSDSLVPGAGLLSLREAVAFANTRFPAGTRASPSTPTVFATPQTITLTGTPARAEQHERDGDDHGPGGGRDGQRRRAEPGVPGRRECHGVDLGTDDHRRHDHWQRRRPVQRGGTSTLTNCTVSGNSAGSAAAACTTVGTTDADQLHRQRQLRRRHSGGGLRPTSRRRPR